MNTQTKYFLYVSNFLVLVYIFFKQFYASHPAFRSIFPIDSSTDSNSIEFYDLKDAPKMIQHIRKKYTLLAKENLKPFVHGIYRSNYMSPLIRELCPQCAVVQVKDYTIHVLDPNNILNSEDRIERLRLTEFLFWVEDALRNNLFNQTELVVSVSDSIVSTNKEHDQFYPPPEFAPRPIFTTNKCTFSDNIGFPMMLGESILAMFPERFGLNSSEKIELASWDKYMAEYMNAAEKPWEMKSDQVVFYGKFDIDEYRYEKALWRQICLASKRNLAKQKGKLKGVQYRVWLDGNCLTNTIKKKPTALSDFTKTSQAYKYYINIDDAGIWPSTLTMEIISPMCVLMMNSPCGLFYKQLLVPEHHYIPLSDELNPAIKLETNGLEVMKKSQNFARDFLSLKSLAFYTGSLLQQYSELRIQQEVRIDSEAIFYKKVKPDVQ